jgi:hypothetical protein
MRNLAWYVGLGLCVACGDDAASDGTGAMPVAAPGMSCNAGMEYACPCSGVAEMGTQLCNLDGRSFAPCLGCPAPMIDPAQAGITGGAAMGGAGGMLASPDAGPGDAGLLPGPADAAAPPPALGPTCGVGLPVVCELGSELCCVRSLDTDTCVAADALGACDCPIQGCDVLTVRCDGPEDCDAGQVCCGTLSGGNNYSEFQCAASCDHTGMQRIACHIGSDMCPAGTICANSQLLTNIQVCIDPSTIEQ